MKNEFKATVNRNAIDNLTPEQLEKVLKILVKIK